MRFWWVSQGKTAKYEVPGGYMWSPKKKANGHRNYHFEAMTDTRPGDIVFSFSEGHVRAVGVVTAGAVTAPKPSSYAAAAIDWGDEGWFVEVVFVKLAMPLSTADHIAEIRPHLPNRYAPLTEDGTGREIYLTEISATLAAVLGRLVTSEYEHALSTSQRVRQLVEEDSHQAQIDSRSDIGPTEREQLCKARRGQGLFRSRVEMVEPHCRLSGVIDRQHLRASHIKPWCKSTDQEKLDGDNGLLLAPHVDHLFDAGFISFTDAGELLVSPSLNRAVLSAWGLQANLKTPPLRVGQAFYMDYHRREIFGKRT